jgi:probable phosphoglycerate mutase
MIRPADVTGVTSGPAGRAGWLQGIAAATVLAAAASAAVASGPLDTLGPVPPEGVRVVLVRHGQAYSNLSPAPALSPEELDRLTDLGREQSRRAGEALRGRGASVVLTSPAGRAHGTAREIAGVLGIDVRVEPRLRPLDLGTAPDGKELSWDQRIAEWKAGKDPVPPGGESLDQLGERVAGLVASLRAEGPGRTVVLVCHSDVVAAYLGELSDTRGAARWPPRVGNGSLTIVDVPASGTARVRATNHLPPEPAPSR